ncbi:MAG: excinuclease ABC subunit UvrC [Gemmatimonadetes bacterium]|nr:excinuclease ABC subunit UvrC [Gemmatimonadota bacterium]
MTKGVPFDAGHVARLSTRPGVYLLRSGDGEILYVGKAKSLRARVRSYLSLGWEQGVKTRELVRHVRRVETIVVGTEGEALILEANLIKEHQPRFNIQLRDDKKYPYIKVTLKEPFPRVYVTRNVRSDGSRYFGPFVSVGRMRQALEALKRIYTVRSCRYRLPKEAPVRPCLDYHIGRCKAPCVGLQSQEDYRAMIEEMLHVLSGDVTAIQAETEAKMHGAAESLDFERAGHYRDVLAGLDGIARQQRVQALEGGNQDVVGLARDGDQAVATTLRIRNGVLIGQHSHFMTEVTKEEDGALISRFASHAYLSSGASALAALPKEILLPSDFEDRGLLEEILTEEAGHKVVVRVPRRGSKVRLVDLATANARKVLDDRRMTAPGAPRTDEVLYDLQERLGLKVVPRVMVCFDVSHTQGTETVASAVLFVNGEPKRAGYRHMKIRGEWGNDDFRSMHEAVTRYFRRMVEDDDPLPDLVLIDGGKGQLSSAVTALSEVGVPDAVVAALAKKEEVVFTPWAPDGIRIPRTERSLHLLQRVRDEAHRFAVTYNRKLRSRRTVRSELGDIPGVGPSRQRTLLGRFGSVRGVREATAEEIARLPGFGDALATRILTWLKGSND